MFTFNVLQNIFALMYMYIFIYFDMNNMLIKVLNIMIKYQICEYVPQYVDQSNQYND